LRFALRFRPILHQAQYPDQSHRSIQAFSNQSRAARTAFPPLLFSP
jgi:hypothetical protein